MWAEYVMGVSRESGLTPSGLTRPECGTGAGHYPADAATAEKVLAPAFPACHEALPGRGGAEALSGQTA
ncbi:hypothetical protein Misp01_31550 [Microtetraspora sp. NBRC 13810]|nr:hypothetical protein Misp01_31550 [Microtetraspora sp. NBRC 13810]